MRAEAIAMRGWMSVGQTLLRLGLVSSAIAAWYWTQRALSRRQPPIGRIADKLLDVTGSLNRFLTAHRAWRRGVLVVSSALVDVCGLFLLVLTVVGPSLRPLLGLVLIFGLRQLCQWICLLPRPEGTIWERPGVPSMLVTYGTLSDLFFSGHTALAVYATLELSHLIGGVGALVGVGVTLVQVVAVIILRTHYTMDVFAGIVTALWAWTIVSASAPAIDSAAVAWLG
jgi:hypothetical protein